MVFIMTSLQMTPSLRKILFADAATSAACCLLLSFCAGILAPLLGLSDVLLRVAGLSLLPFAAFVAYLATSGSSSRAAVWAVILCNAVWVIDSLLLLVGGWAQPTFLGYAFVAAQALVVGIFAELEFIALRRISALA